VPLQSTDFSRVLEELRIVDLSRGFAGAFCGHALAQLGARVHAVRNIDADLSSEERQRMLALDHHKAVESFDCYDPENLDRVAELCHGAAMIIEERPCAGWPTQQPIAAHVLAAEPDLTAICISPFGLYGPHASYAAAPLNTYHSAGHAQQIPCDSLWPEYKTRAPMQAGGYWGESQAGLLAAVAALAVVTGNGSWKGHIIDCSKQEALLQMHWTELVKYPNSGRLVDRLEPSITFVGGVLPSSDGFVQIVALEQHQWEGLVKLLGEPEWMASEDYTSQKKRVAQWEKVTGLLAQETVKHTRQTLFVEGQALGVPIAPIMSIAELKVDKALSRRGVFGNVGEENPLGPRWDNSVFSYGGS
tara:strand:- start:11962 stop:13041 length:1080 start_codon:yes stop_codon:yes gene_type:complete